jgi:hypothetical protein
MSPSGRKNDFRNLALRELSARVAASGPLVCLLDQVIDDRIGEGVDHLFEDVLGLDELDGRGLFGGPRGLPAEVESVLVLCDQLGEIAAPRLFSWGTST